MSRDSKLWQDPQAHSTIYEGDVAECVKWLGVAKARLRFMLRSTPGATSVTWNPTPDVQIRVDARPGKITIRAEGGIYITVFDPASADSTIFNNPLTIPFEDKVGRLLYKTPGSVLAKEGTFSGGPGYLYDLDNTSGVLAHKYMKLQAGHSWHNGKDKAISWSIKLARFRYSTDPLDKVRWGWKQYLFVDGKKGEIPGGFGYDKLFTACVIDPSKVADRFALGLGTTFVVAALFIHVGSKFDSPAVESTGVATLRFYKLTAFGDSYLVTLLGSTPVGAYPNYDHLSEAWPRTIHPESILRKYVFSDFNYSAKSIALLKTEDDVQSIDILTFSDDYSGFSTSRVYSKSIQMMSWDITQTEDGAYRTTERSLLLEDGDPGIISIAADKEDFCAIAQDITSASYDYSSTVNFVLGQETLSSTASSIEGKVSMLSVSLAGVFPALEIDTTTRSSSDSFTRTPMSANSTQSATFDSETIKILSYSATDGYCIYSKCTKAIGLESSSSGGTVSIATSTSTTSDVFIKGLFGSSKILSERYSISGSDSYASASPISHAMVGQLMYSYPEGGRPAISFEMDASGDSVLNCDIPCTYAMDSYANTSGLTVAVILPPANSNGMGGAHIIGIDKMDMIVIVGTLVKNTDTLVPFTVKLPRPITVDTVPIIDSFRADVYEALNTEPNTAGMLEPVYTMLSPMSLTTASG